MVSDVTGNVLSMRTGTTTTPTKSVTPLTPDPELFEMVKRSDIGRGASDDDVRMFLYTANRLGLDPFARQIYMRANDHGHMQTILTIDGYRTVADRTGECDGQDPPQWCGADGVWRDVWLGNDAPHACRITVYRKGHSRGYTGVATYMSYAVFENGVPTKTWAKLPDAMLAKVCESIALRKAFPQQLAGTYTAEEMEQAFAKSSSRALGAANTPQRQDAPSQRKKTKRSASHTLELNADGMEWLLGRIRSARTEEERRGCLPMIAMLVPHQKDQVRIVWREYTKPTKTTTTKAATNSNAVPIATATTAETSQDAAVDPIESGDTLKIESDGVTEEIKAASDGTEAA